MDIFTEAQRRDAAASAESPVRTTEISPGPREEQEPRAPPWVIVSTQYLLSPRIATRVAIRGERQGEGGCSLPISESHVSSLIQCLSARSVSFANRKLSAPSPLPSPPPPKTCWGRGQKLIGTPTQGGRSVSCRWRRPGLLSDAPLGLYKEKSASCRLTNAQSPGGRYYKGRSCFLFVMVRDVYPRETQTPWP